jgi:hypothetical protein
MNAIFLLSTAFLITVFALFSAATWRLYRWQGKPRPAIEYLLMATVFGAIASQALTWLGATHPEASEARHASVWLQLITASGITVLMAVCALLSFTRRAPRPVVGSH